MVLVLVLDSRRDNDSPDSGLDTMNQRGSRRYGVSGVGKRLPSTISRGGNVGQSAGSPPAAGYRRCEHIMPEKISGIAEARIDCSIEGGGHGVDIKVDALRGQRLYLLTTVGYTPSAGDYRVNPSCRGGKQNFFSMSSAKISTANPAGQAAGCYPPRPRSSGAQGSRAA